MNKILQKKSEYQGRANLNLNFECFEFGIFFTAGAGGRARATVVVPTVRTSNTGRLCCHDTVP